MSRAPSSTIVNNAGVPGFDAIQNDKQQVGAVPRRKRTIERQTNVSVLHNIRKRIQFLDPTPPRVNRINNGAQPRYIPYIKSVF